MSGSGAFSRPSPPSPLGSGPGSSMSGSGASSRPSPPFPLGSGPGAACLVPEHPPGPRPRLVAGSGPLPPKPHRHVGARLIAKGWGLPAHSDNDPARGPIHQGMLRWWQFGLSRRCHRSRHTKPISEVRPPLPYCPPPLLSRPTGIGAYTPSCPHPLPECPGLLTSIGADARRQPRHRPACCHHHVSRAPLTPRGQSQLRWQAFGAGRDSAAAVADV